MASYFDEHDCQPLGDGQQPNHMLHLARLIIDGGHFSDEELAFAFNGERAAPPASKQIVQSLPSVIVTSEMEGKCAICLGPYEEGDRLRKMPCGHTFHHACIIPWLERTNTCPFCRQELPTDDPDYEEYRKHKARAKQREYEIEALHDSMFG
ncbi:hypothetical protein LSH36_6g02054 [Paralvinella palmiformis]|uniref:RING-type E3 ubiquitin transferase n=1 Tax=Paralvinella palmiformis TaxID=53620 RepID=A0AAD9NIK4_9ANNE|nr:hypothetical protein LSH36_6g02054 [Paralvinella palmiformis]